MVSIFQNESEWFRSIIDLFVYTDLFRCASFFLVVFLGPTLVTQELSVHLRESISPFKLLHTQCRMHAHDTIDTMVEYTYASGAWITLSLWLFNTITMRLHRVVSCRVYIKNISLCITLSMRINVWFLRFFCFTIAALLGVRLEIYYRPLRCCGVSHPFFLGAHWSNAETSNICSSNGQSNTVKVRVLLLSTYHHEQWAAKLLFC